MNFPEVMSFVTGLLQFIVAGYALRLNRIFGTARVGWSLFWAFTLLALIHLVQSIASYNSGQPPGAEIEVIYSLISLLLLTGLIHIETLLKERRSIEEEEKRMRDKLEFLVNDKTAHLTRAIKDLQSEIEERKRAEKALRVSEDNLRRAQAVAQTGSWHLDLRTNVLTWSAETYRMFGVREGKTLTQQSFSACVHPADREKVLEAWNAALRGAPYDIEHRIVVGNEIRWVRERAETTFNAHGKAVEIVGTVQDITGHKKDAAQIQEQARLLELAHDAIMVRDMEDRILYWNQSSERIYGWTAREAIGRKLSELLPKDMFNALKYEEASKALLETGNWQGELTSRNKSGEEITMESRWTLLRDEQGVAKSILGISNDITEKRRFETQFLRAQRMENIGALASGIAHDLNNILTPLLVSVQVLKEKNTDLDGKKLLESLETNVQRGASLVKQVLIFGRGVEAEHAPLNLKHVAHEVRQVVHETFPKSVDFELDCPKNLWTIVGNATQLHQILMNLCVNARDAMPSGGKLTVQVENMLLDEDYAAKKLEAHPGPYVVITVADTGAGIPKEIQEKIFDPFFTTKEPGKGTGLGLSTTLAIVKGHDGFINCYSEPNKGTVFKVYLPATPAPSAEEKPAADSRILRGNNEMVLVVDDEEPILNLAQKALKRYGYRVLLAPNGVEAIALYARRQREIDVVITDMLMPVMDGPTTIVALKAINPNIKIIGSSGLTSKDGAAVVDDAGIHHFLSKPYTAETMLNVLHEVLREDRLKQSLQSIDKASPERELTGS